MSKDNKSSRKTKEELRLELCARIEAEAEGKTIEDLGELVLEGDYDVALQVITDCANDIIFKEKSKAARKRGLQRLRNHIANINKAARAANEHWAYKNDISKAFQLCSDAGSR